MMPDDEALRQAFAHFTALQPVEGKRVFSRRMAINMADFFGLHVRELVKACEQLQLLQPGAWQWFLKNGGFTEEHFTITRRDRKL